MQSIADISDVNGRVGHVTSGVDHVTGHVTSGVDHVTGHVTSGVDHVTGHVTSGVDHVTGHVTRLPVHPTIVVYTMYAVLKKAKANNPRQKTNCCKQWMKSDIEQL